MIKKRLLTYWFKKIDKDGDYRKLKQDKVLYSILNKRYSLFKTRSVFILMFLVSSIYFIFLKSELYESQTSLIVRDLSSQPQASDLGLNILGVGGQSELKDSMLVQEYILSLDMFKLIDKKFNLIDHYRSDDIDFIERLSKDSKMEENLEFYRKRVIVLYDEVSSIIHLSFAHTDKIAAQDIVKFIIKNVENELNELNKQKAEKQLTFIKQEYKKNKQKMEESSKKLEEYQNKNLFLDPNAEATSSSSIIANLEATLIQKKIDYKTKSNYLNSDNYELKALKSEIKEISKSLEKSKKSLTGDSKTSLNRMLFEYEKLKMQLEFDTEVYKNTLIQLKTTEIEVQKNAKTLSIITKPNLPDGYSYPNKIKTFITIIIVILLMYGIFSMLFAIIKDHKE